MLNCLKDYENWYPEDAKYISNHIDDMIADFCKIDKELWLAAKNRVFADGYYGPIHSNEWIESGNCELVADIDVALGIVREALGISFDDIEYVNPEYDTVIDNDDYEIPNMMIDGRDIYREVFKWHKEIYGGYQ